MRDHVASHLTDAEPGDRLPARATTEAGAGRRHRAGSIPAGQAAIVGVNIRALRQRQGWTQAELGELMGWHSASTVCAAEGRRDGRQRGLDASEVERLAAIFGVSPRQLTTPCANCNGQPPAGFACLACGAALDGHRSASRLDEASASTPIAGTS
jgi:transcriptional regulator with XRE-family HTH domain